MITESLLDIFLNLLNGVFSLLPDIEIDFAPYEEAINAVFSFFQYVFYFFPMDTVIYCVSIILIFHLFKIVVSFIRTVWDLLPLV